MPKLAAGHDAAAPGRGRSRRVTTTLAEINVVPLVDVMLVLLIIFMVAAPMIQRGIDVKLPAASRTQQMQGERVYVTIPATFEQTRTLFLGDKPVRIDLLPELVRQKVEGQPEKQVYLRGDSKISYQDLMDVVDRLKGAGVQNIGLINRPPDAR